MMFAILLEYCKLGGNFLDGAVNYQDGQSEEWIGEWIQERQIPRNEHVIAIKVLIARNSKKNIVACLDLSLKRLRVDYADLYCVHYWDYMTQPGEILRALDGVVRQGKVLFTGINDTPAWEVARMNTLAECNNMTPFSVYQGKSLRERDMDRDIMPMCRELGVGVIPWGGG
ncbi:norsolorinic acid reductase/dehydrogenase [Gonapodya prolifera JEL478]|uniref:Norsolorinic acid reductase/dehydrogenase n=1 Tax=Gonapodya prolifera (strain JEL478) TaxID=1344416 RepID=A0A139A5Q6_GONPJ|nr:norsolorinic acid reductase/dehydrogenase [Gonapodya prolifera JEL478]|eukprot:KXS12117.1 norsolorinic acid reductase/dehydrogenase [Gonapodya prolifera JEL478]